jgi:hypothetical protein
MLRPRFAQVAAFSGGFPGEGFYYIRTTHQSQGAQPAGWGLAAWHWNSGSSDFPCARNGGSTWVYTHEGNVWPMMWHVVPGKKANTWRLLTTKQKASNQEAGWGLAAWHAHGAARNAGSSWVAVHSGDHVRLDSVARMQAACSYHHIMCLYADPRSAFSISTWRSGQWTGRSFPERPRARTAF